MKKTQKASDYRERYSNVLPNAKVIADTKHFLPIQQEKNTVLATALHFNTTSRKKIKGEWPLIIIRMNDGKKFKIRPLSIWL